MIRAKLHLEDPDGTARFGSLLARVLRGGDMVVLSGELGAGKTTLVRAVACALGVDPRLVSSPTFTVMHEYVPPDGGPVIVHVDAYRLEGEDESELDLLGWDRAAAGESIVLIEWGERIAGLLDRDYAAITLNHEGEQERAARLVVPEAWRSRAGWSDLVRLFADPSGMSPGFPFASEREQYADLYRWLSESYRISRPIDRPDPD